MANQGKPWNPAKNTKLTEADVYRIRALAKAGTATVPELANGFGIGRETVRRIIRRETWEFLPEEQPATPASPAEAAEANESALRALAIIEGKPKEQSNAEDQRGSNESAGLVVSPEAAAAVRAFLGD